MCRFINRIERYKNNSNARQESYETSLKRVKAKAKGLKEETKESRTR